MKTPAQRPPLPLPDASPLAVPDDFAARLAAEGITVSPAALTGLADYLARLIAMNELVNLTAITTPADAWVRHGLDAWTLLPLLADLAAGASVIDVGSGGGVPAIPVAIARPDLRVVMVESTQKKAAFLKAVAKALKLSKVDVRDERAESVMRTQRGRHDVVTARAVSRLSTLIPITVPFLKAGGRALFIKGAKADEELAEAAAAMRDYHLVHERTVQTETGRVLVLRYEGVKRV